MRTLVLDLQNTIYEEFFEYGPAIEAGVQSLEDTLGALDRRDVYRQMSVCFRGLGSDWDMRVWDTLPLLLQSDLPEDRRALLAAQAERAFIATARGRTRAGLYEGAKETLEAIRKKGVKIIIVTECTLHATAERLIWLGLDGHIDALYAWPGKGQAVQETKTPLRPFPEAGGKNTQTHLTKPHPFVLARVAMDLCFLEDREISEFFRLEMDTSRRLPELPAKSPLSEAACGVLKRRKTRHRDALGEALNTMIYAGDSLFKDAVMAKGAGVTYAHAAYGSAVPEGEESHYKHCKDIMLAVSGWDADILSLTHEAGQSRKLAAIKPDISLTRFEELADLFP
jgi:FMN phosphatase YigB (HAD superfamily)